VKAVEETVTITRDAPVESVVEATETTEDAEGRAPQVVAALQNLEGVIGESVTLEATVQGTVPHLSGLLIQLLGSIFVHWTGTYIDFNLASHGRPI